MGHVLVAIKDSQVFYSHYSNSLGVNAYAGASAVHDLAALVATPFANFQIFKQNAVQLSSDDFIRFKKGGKRLPSKSAVPKVVGKHAKSRGRPDRSTALVQIGDVGPYKTGPGSLNYKAALSLERDHMNSAAANWRRTFVLNLGPWAHQGLSKGQVQARGIAVAIDPSVHSQTYSYKWRQMLTDTPTGQKRMEWVAQFPGPGFEKELTDALSAHYAYGSLTFEMIGSYRYLYRLNVKLGAFPPSDDLDALIEAYLRVAH